MEQITISHLTFAYEEESAFSLRDVSFTVEQGEILLIIGESGCGKTTLLRHLKRDYMPSGKRSTDSQILIDGKKIETLNEAERTRLVGFVRQNADAALVTDKVWHELAFGLENLGCSQELMQRKIAEMTAFFGLEGIYYEKLCNLSGGQKQMVNLASVMVMDPEVLVLDEPTSQLDPIAAEEFFHMIEKIHREIGTTIILTEHRLEDVFSLCDRVMVLDQGRILMEGSPRQVAAALYRSRRSLYKALPTAARMYLELDEKVNSEPKDFRKKEASLVSGVNLGKEEKSAAASEDLGKQEAADEENKIPLTVRDGKKWMECRYLSEKRPEIFREQKERDPQKKKKGDTALSADELWFRYEPDSRDILKACSIELEKQTITAIMGGNGAGKSTLLHILAGHYKARRGKIRECAGNIGMLPQNPQAMFVKKTVREELESSFGMPPLNNRYESLKEEASRVQEIIDFCDLDEVLEQHPFDLSGGQMQKLALAKLLLEDYDILLLDEPGKGMDYAFKQEMGKLLRQLTSMGKTVLMVSHDVEFCARYADVCSLFFDGHMVSVSKTRTFFLQNVFYTTAAARMCRTTFPKTVLIEDVLDVFRAEQEDKSVCQEIDQRKQRDDGLAESEVRNSEVDDRLAGIKAGNSESEQLKRNYWISLGIFFVVMPLTIYIGHYLLQQRKYYFISILLVLEAVLSFFLSFEKRKPKLRESMVIVVLTAVTVTGRAAFYMVPHAKPMAALIILSGAGLGGEAGFLVGALSMLVSNIFFGQGPWTPWQMFAMGILGFVSGIIFRQDSPCTKKKKYGICLTGFFSVIILYGGIMNPATVLMYQENINWNMILSAYAMGVPFDLVHAAFTFLFLWLGTRPVLEKIERIRRKIY